ncbi:TM2 domain-containing protein [Corynebacterium stationis]|uniref:TM2 domain-containing protein n=1 Tax=Corynebacterium stationis TaxID=1705 RepID=UPI00242F6C30|nr:TM2 domain-containing protein [Corynebacterium stationis]
MTNPYNSFEPNPDGFDARMQQDPQTQSYAQYQESLNNPQAQYPQFNAFQQQPQAGAPAPYGQQHGMAHPGMMQPAMYATPPKSWIATLLLAFFLGTLGAHNFYLGYKGRAIAQLSLSVIGWFTAILIVGFVLLAIVGIWAFVDLVRILIRHGEYGVDPNGVPLS